MVVVLVVLCAAGRSAGAQVPSEVRGRVTSRVDGRGVVGARVEDMGDDAAAMSDDDGAFTIRGLAPGAHDFRVTAIGYRAAHTTVAVENGRVAATSVVMDPLPARLDPVSVRDGADSSGDATTISRTAIDASGQQELGGLLAQVPGVLVTRQGGPGAPAYVSIRGSNSDEVLVVVDGQPINSTLSGEADLSRIPLANVEQVTVIRGAESARYGPGALAGVVLIETRRPTGTALSATASVGSWGSRDGAVSGDVDVPHVAGGVVTVSRTTTQDDFPYDVPPERGGGDAIRQNDDAALTSISAALNTRGPIGLSMQGAATEGARGLPGSVSAPDCCARNGDTRVSGGASAHADHGPVAWTVALDADHERTRYQDSEPAIPPAYDDRATTTSVMGSATAAVAGPVVSLAGGADSRAISIAATALTATAPSTERYDGLWTQARASHPLGDGFTGAIDGTVRIDWNSLADAIVASPRIALSVGHRPLLASVLGGQAYNPPSLADQYFREGVLVRPNPDLRPERVRDEVEGRLALRELALGAVRITGEVAVYRADVTGMILWFPDFRFIWSPDNYDVRRAGWDGSTELSLPRLGLRLRATVSDVSVDYVGPVLGGQVAYRPRVTAATAAGITRGRVSAELTTQYIGDRRTVQGSTLNTLAPYWVTDVHATVSLVRRVWPLDATLGVDDVFDDRAALLVDYPYPGRTVRLGLRIHHASAD
jgi:outer membrane cobalamin receptor